LIEYAKTGRGVSIATSTDGSPTVRLFESALAVKLVGVPYRGAGPAMQDVASGVVDLSFTGLSQIRPHLQSGRVKLLATTGARRLRSAPETPTLDEQGMKGFVAEVWWGVLAPAGTPKDVIAKVNRALKASMADPDVAKRLEIIDGQVKVSSPEEFGRMLDSEIERWRKVLKPASPH
jgi:tripartite-type tricarboxylate transporter receptor subunit TctC